MLHEVLEKVQLCRPWAILDRSTKPRICHWPRTIEVEGITHLRLRDSILPHVR